MLFELLNYQGFDSLAQHAQEISKVYAVTRHDIERVAKRYFYAFLDPRVPLACCTTPPGDTHVKILAEFAGLHEFPISFNSVRFEDLQTEASYFEHINEYT